MEHLLMERRGAALRISLDRPEVLNALTPDLLAEFRGALEDAATDAEVRAVMLTGSGRAFCAGADLGVMAMDASVDELIETWYNPVVRAIVRAQKPVIAAVNGVAAGAGMSLALEARLQSEAAQSEDAREGLAAFAQKRNPNFRGI